MSSLEIFKKLSWYKPDWSYLSKSEETGELLKQCAELPKVELSGDVIEEIINRSKEFPIAFPRDKKTMRLETLKARRPIERLKNNILSTYPVVHERVLLLMTRFLAYKREFGSEIEQRLYKDITVAQFIERLLKKRAVTFMRAVDFYKLATGESDASPLEQKRKKNKKACWEEVGTPEEKPPLLLENVLSYDEIKVSAYLYVSGKTECINNGARKNAARVCERDIEENGVIIGIVGARFKRKNRMDWEDCMITADQNTVENGFGVSQPNKKDSNLESRRKWRELWAEFFEVPNRTYDEVIANLTLEDKDPVSQYTDRYVKLPKTTYVFDNEVYYKRVCIIAETCLLEAESRGKEEGREVFLYIVGAGLGVWMINKHQIDVYVLTFLDRIRALLNEGRINQITDVHLAYIRPSSTIRALFPDNDEMFIGAQGMFLESKTHPKGGIRVRVEDREPATKLPAPYADKLLVMTYAWDGNAQPGNEFWIGKVAASGDSAAAASTQVSELHNSGINPLVAAANTRVAGQAGLRCLQEYCKQTTL